MPTRRYAFALCASLLLHAGLIAASALLPWWSAPHSPPLRAELRATALAIPVDNEALLKNTLAAAEAKKPLAPPVPQARVANAADIAEALQEKMAPHIYYPAEARRLGLQGEVRLLLVFDAAGALTSVEVASGSGHAILDEAAVAALHTVGAQPALAGREILFPVRFSLR